VKKRKKASAWGAHHHELEPVFWTPSDTHAAPSRGRKIGVEPERRDSRDGIAHPQFHLHSGFLGASEIANKWFRFNGRGAIGTPDPLRPRQFPTVRRSRLFSDA